MSYNLSINGQAVTTIEEVKAAIPADAVFVGDNISEPYEASFFVEALGLETGYPTGPYTTYTAAQWAEVEADTEEDPTC